MELNNGQLASLRFRLLSAADGSPLPSFVWSDLDCRYAKSSSLVFAVYALSAEKVKNLGLGFYEIAFLADVLDALGPFTSYLTATGAVPDWREDVVVQAATAWQGYPIRFVTEDDGDPIVDCHVQVRNADGTLILAQGTTDTDGLFSAMLSAGTYKVYAWKPGYTFAAAFPLTAVVTAATTFTIEGDVFSPANPGGPDVTTVNGWLLDATGAARVGVAVSFTPILEDQASCSEKDSLRPLASTSTSKLVSRVPIVATTDAQGAFSVSLTPNSDLTPAGSRYLVEFSDSPADVALITVGATSPVNIEDLLSLT